MSSTRELPSEIEQALARNWVVLTANQRAARALRRAFDLRQHALGRTHWQPPQILAWDSWLASLWRQLLLEGRTDQLLLSAAQERTLWRAVVEADDATRSLRPLDALAQSASETWLLLHAYNGRGRLRDYAGNTDTQAFSRWVTAFERRCAAAHYLTEAQLAETLRAAVVAGQIAPPPGLLLIGFDSKTSAQEALLDALRATGSELDELVPGLAPGAPSSSPSGDRVGDRILIEAPDEHAELAACARWLRSALTTQPDARLAVIVPAIEPTRADIDRAFRRTLAPELDDIAAPADSGPYEFSLGVTLARTPMVAAALDILRWSTGPLPLDRVCALLLSPHFAATPSTGSEYVTRAEFDAFTLRCQPLLRPEISLDEMLLALTGSRHSLAAPALRTCLLAMGRLVSARNLDKRHTHAEWASFIHELLAAAGWAPLGLLDSIEFQTLRKWESALDELATLDFAGTTVPFAAALAALRRIAAETLFAPESHFAPVQIMGPLESAGSSFDAIWFLRANDLDWPATPAPSPLLPFGLQRELAMPGADPACDTAHARRITERIAASAPSVIFSFSRERESGDAHQRPSALLASLSLERNTAAQLSPETPESEPITLDEVSDDAAIPSPDGLLRGGAAILQSQAACAFRAFAEHRLFSSALDPAPFGLDAMQRGSLVHDVLYRFWSQVSTQAALRAMPSADRDSQLAACIDAALAQHHARPAPGWPRAYLDAERQRLLDLLRPWLDLEACRQPFAVNALEETRRDVQIGPLHLSVRVDRVDTALIDGEPAGEIILDYKTGGAKPSDWTGPRPDAPQLPLYAVVSGAPELAGVAFASVRRGKDLDLRGYEARSGVLPNSVRPEAGSLAAQVEEWRGTLESLATSFHAGDTAVLPKHYPQTCQYCEQRLLCRLSPSSLEPDVLEEIEDESESLEEDDFV